MLVEPGAKSVFDASMPFHAGLAVLAVLAGLAGLAGLAVLWEFQLEPANR
jgi:hypothetical protein